MSEPIKNAMEALSVALRVVDAQDKLLSAYRTGTRRTPEAAIDYLTKHKPRLAAWRYKSMMAALTTETEEQK